MLSITIEVDIDPMWAFAVKEELAMLLEERYEKTVRVVAVEVKEGKGKC